MVAGLDLNQRLWVRGELPKRRARSEAGAGRSQEASSGALTGRARVLSFLVGPLEAAWESRMLAGDYRTWFAGEKRSYIEETSSQEEGKSDCELSKPSSLHLKRPFLPLPPVACRVSSMNRSVSPKSGSSSIDQASAAWISGVHLASSVACAQRAANG